MYCNNILHCVQNFCLVTGHILCIYIFVHGHWQLTLPTCQYIFWVRESLRWFYIFHFIQRTHILGQYHDTYFNILHNLISTIALCTRYHNNVLTSVYEFGCVWIKFASAPGQNHGTALELQLINSVIFRTVWPTRVVCLHITFFSQLTGC